MEAVVFDERGNQYALPPLFAWRISHGCGEACDDFALSFAHDASQDAVLPKLVRVEAYHEGKQVLRGQPDEWSASWGLQGRVSHLWGRGPQALLTDDEAEPAQFAHATWRDITARYVTPKGILAEDDALPAFPGFRVESGASLWQAVIAYARDHAGRQPRFSPDGRLRIGAFAQNASLTLALPGRATDAAFTVNRHGVIAETLVRNRDTLKSYTVKNDAFPGPGGSRRVVTGVGREGVAQMERSARLSMRRSLRGYLTARVTLPWAFAAPAGETLTLSGAPEGFGGPHVVWEAESACDARSGPSTVLTLLPLKYL